MSKAATLADLKRSGLTAADFKKLQIEVLTPAQNVKLTNKKHNVPGYVMPYFNVDGSRIKNGWRRRNLVIPKGRFGEYDDPGKYRYTGPADELPHLYFPQNFGNWPAQAKDVTEPLFITEGEKKAACMCKNGFATIAVPGVWGWRSKAKGIDLLDDFKQIDWGDADNPRAVYMVFDNDVIVKQQVLQALNALSRKLVTLGAQVFIKMLPDGPLKGADDFIVNKGADAFANLSEEEFADSAAIWEMQETVAYVKSNNYFVDVGDLRTFPDAGKLRQAFGNLSRQVPKADGDGTKTVYIIDEWMRHPSRRTHDRLIFKPGAGAVVGKSLNTWRGWPVEPVKGNVKPFLDLCDVLFVSEPNVLPWFLQWLAYPLQYPGAKLATGVLTWSTVQGCGKSLVGDIVREIYGKYASRIEKDDIIGGWTDWLIHKQFIHGEEITGGDSRHVADKVKNMITRTTAINKVKYAAHFEIEDCANYYLTSNHEDSLHLAPQDRRFLVVNCPAKHKDGNQFYDGVSDWYRNKDGVAHLFHYLLNEIDLTGFKPFAAAPHTEAKAEMVEASKSSLQMLLEEILGDPDRFTIYSKRGDRLQRDVFRVEEILHMVGLGERQTNFINPASRLLKRLGSPGKKTRIGTLYPIRNFEKWGLAVGAEFLADYRKDKPDPSVPPKHAATKTEKGKKK